MTARLHIIRGYLRPLSVTSSYIKHFEAFSPPTWMDCPTSPPLPHPSPAALFTPTMSTSPVLTLALHHHPNLATRVLAITPPSMTIRPISRRPRDVTVLRGSTQEEARWRREEAHLPVSPRLHQRAPGVHRRDVRDRTPRRQQDPQAQGPLAHPRRRGHRSRQAEVRFAPPPPCPLSNVLALRSSKLPVIESNMVDWLRDCPANNTPIHDSAISKQTLLVAKQELRASLQLLLLQVDRQQVRVMDLYFGDMITLSNHKFPNPGVNGHGPVQSLKLPVISNPYRSSSIGSISSSRGSFTSLARDGTDSAPTDPTKDRESGQDDAPRHHQRYFNAGLCSSKSPRDLPCLPSPHVRGVVLPSPHLAFHYDDPLHGSFLLLLLLFQPILKVDLPESQEPLLKESKHRFVLFPIRFHKVWPMYEKAWASFWNAEEMDLSEDLHSWNKHLSDNERHFIFHVPTFFAATDGTVNENLVVRSSRPTGSTSARRPSHSTNGVTLCTALPPPSIQRSRPQTLQVPRHRVPTLPSTTLVSARKPSSSPSTMTPAKIVSWLRMGKSKTSSIIANIRSGKWIGSKYGFMGAILATQLPHPIAIVSQAARHH
ncbi:hypothetical protein NMY22_g17688 [Coprinellus aureogranulatus]|nr:hypothetical protein NMY22_g17688 [Coprinellus aureogranulatus]